MFCFKVLILMFLVSLYTSCIYPFFPPSMLIVPPLIRFTCSWLSVLFIVQLCTILPIIAVFVILDFSVLLSGLRVLVRLI